MSTRYVYGVYNTTVEQNKEITEQALFLTGGYNLVEMTPCSSYTSGVAYNRQGTPVTLYTPKDGEGWAVDGSGGMAANYVYDTSKYKYIVLTLTIRGSTDIVSECYLLEASLEISGLYWHVYLDPSAGFTVWNSDYSGNDKTLAKPFYRNGGTIEKGSAIVTYQSKGSKTLEEGAFVSGTTWRWRAYRGSDTIDPTAVSYSENDLYPGEPVTITVTPRTPTYGGTIYYQYQYSTNGTTWTNIGSKTTATSATVTIPEGVEQFRARALASDGWGFTSTTYVYGPSLGVSQLKAYATIQGTHRPLSKAYAIIDGTVREISKGYVTIGGVWKKLF